MSGSRGWARVRPRTAWLARLTGCAVRTLHPLARLFVISQLPKLLMLDDTKVGRADGSTRAWRVWGGVRFGSRAHRTDPLPDADYRRRAEGSASALWRSSPVKDQRSQRLHWNLLAPGVSPRVAPCRWQPATSTSRPRLLKSILIDLFFSVCCYVLESLTDNTHCRNHIVWTFLDFPSHALWSPSRWSTAAGRCCVPFMVDPTQTFDFYRNAARHAP